MNQSMQSHYRGLLYTVIEDFGPQCRVNLSNPLLTEEHTLAIVVQSFTLLGLGSGSRSAGNWFEMLYGPLPLPTGRPLNSLIYAFLIQGDDSNDERVRRSGRSAAIIFLVTRQFKMYDALREFIEDYMPQWLKKHPKVSERSLRDLDRTMKTKDFFSKISHEKKKDIKTGGLDGVVPASALKISFLEKIAEMDNLTEALYRLYNTGSTSPNLENLANIAGVSKFMLKRRYINNYVKAGLIEVDEQENIHFLIPQPSRS